MKKSVASKFLIIFFAPVVIIVLVFVVFKKDTPNLVLLEEKNEQKEEIVSFSNKSLDKKSKDLEININYPEISGLEEKIQNRINTDISLKIEKFFSEFVSSNTESISGLENTLDVEYENPKIFNNIISIKFSVSEYVSGSAHPFGYNLVFNYDSKTGAYLHLENLFKDNSDYLNKISSLARIGLDKKFSENEWSPSEWSDEGTLPLKENFEQFFLEESNLVIVFNPYQVAPYVYGIIEVPIGIKDVSSILKEEYR